MATYNKYTAAVEPLVEADNAGTAAWKIALALTINAADTTFVAGTTDLATGNGYTAGGNAASTTSSAQSGGVYKLLLAVPATWTATGAGFTFRYVILYNSTTNVPYGYWDNGSNIVMSGANSDTFIANIDTTNGMFTVT